MNRYRSYGNVTGYVRREENMIRALKLAALSALHTFGFSCDDQTASQQGVQAPTA
jgi:hypothetical protein